MANNVELAHNELCIGLQIHTFVDELCEAELAEHLGNGVASA